MADFDSEREERLKLAFSKIKTDIDSLRNEFNALKEIITKQQDLLEVFLSKVAQNRQESQDFEGFSGLPLEGSTGNEGVQTNKQTNNQTNKQTHPKQTNTSLPILSTEEQKAQISPLTPPQTTLPLSAMKKDLLNKFASLPKREFLIFLTIYQLEADKGSVTYPDIAGQLKLSESGVRHYVFNLIKKGAPILKRKINNKSTVLSLLPEFKELNLQKELVDIYLHLDSHQKTLMDEY